MSAIPENLLDALNGASQAAASKTAKKSATEEMSERFMTLFMAQLRNQDPMNPMENAEMTSQLAQMNMVSGLETLNASMQTLLSSYNEALSLQAANLVGKNVLVPGKEVILAGDEEGNAVGGILGIELSGPADKVEVIIRDENGNEIARESLGAQEAGSFAYIWDGKTLSGEKAAPGAYTFSVEASLSGQAVLSQTLQAGTVSALIRGSNGAFLLEVPGLGGLALSEVRQVF